MIRLHLFTYVLLFTPFWALASLGQGPDSLEKDRVALQGESRRSLAVQSADANYKSYEMQVGGTTVRELWGSDGKVFAITWRGLKYPNLESLLGEYYLEFAVQDARKERGRKVLRQPIVTDKIRVVYGGHFPVLFGYAILIGKLPPGVREVDLL